MANRVFLNKENIIESIFDGRQTFSSLTKTSAIIMIISDKLKKNGNDILILADLKEMENVTADALIASYETINEGKFKKLAISGGNKSLRKLTGFIINISGKKNKVRIFSGKKEALKWLKE